MDQHKKDKPDKQKKALYWVTKGLISAFILYSAYIAYMQPEDLRRLGFPDYFRIELVTAKIIGAIALLLPFTPAWIKEWVYAGFTITMVSALIAHICSGDPLYYTLFLVPALVVVLLCIRYVSGKDLSPYKLSE